MTVYTYSKARQNLASLLEKADQEGEVRIQRKDGRVFILRPEKTERSPLDVEGINLGISTDEIIRFISEGRRTDR
ncbi:MAG: type II toxin-antitoxin system Phd/YefM family antitoxin [bacterium]